MVIFYQTCSESCPYIVYIVFLNTSISEWLLPMTDYYQSNYLLSIFLWLSNWREGKYHENQLVRWLRISFSCLIISRMVLLYSSTDSSMDVILLSGCVSHIPIPSQEGKIRKSSIIPSLLCLGWQWRNLFLSHRILVTDIPFRKLTQTFT